ncbi:MAG: hypothetical protein ACD_72C00405G0001 [uncultured bacterium]|nr:MAG: hypothetical protein ACD_72C00405G0001 [uncultured bacterium]
MRPDRAKLAVQAAQPESPPADIKETAKIGAIAAMELNFSTLKHDAEVRVSAGKATGIKLSPFVFAERAWNIISTVITSDEVSSSNHVRDEAIKKIKTFITDAERTDKGLGEAVMAEVLRQDRKLHIELSA